MVKIFKFKFVFILFLFLPLIYVKAQNTSNYYSFVSSSGASLDAMTGSTQLIAAYVDEGVSTVTNIGFTFYYENTPYTQFSVNSNGLFKFGSNVVTVEGYSPVNNMTSSTNQPKLTTYWSDMSTGNSGGGGKVHYILSGSSPNRILKVEFNLSQDGVNSKAADTKSQIWLYENNGVIEFIYGSGVIIGAEDGSIGIGGASSSNYMARNHLTNHTCASTSVLNNINAWPTSGTKYTFSPPTNVFYSNTATTNTATTTLNNWYSNRSGVGGSNPSSFTASGQRFVIQSGHQYQASSTWTGASTSNITIESGGALDINAQTLSTWEGINIAGTGVSNSGALLNSSSSSAASSIPITLTAASTINSSGSGGLTLTGNIVNGGFLLTVDGANATAITTSIISGTGTLTKAGVGTLTLSGANTYTGLTTVSAGTLKLGASSAATTGPLGNVSGGTTVTSGASLDMNGFSLTASATEPLTLNGTGVSSVGALTNSSTTAVEYKGAIALGNAANNYIGTSGNATTGTLTVSGVISGSNPLQIVNTGATTSSVILSGVNTYTGITTVNSGTLKLGASSTSGTTGPLGSKINVAASGTIVSSGASLDMNGFSLTSLATEPLTINGTGVSSAGALTNSSTTAVTWIGTVVLNDVANNYIGTSGNSTVGTLTVSGIISGAKPLQIVNTAAITSSVILSAENTYTGVTTVSSGTLKLGANSIYSTSGILGTNAAGTIVVSGASLDMNGFSLTANATENLTLNGTGISNGGALMNSGAACTYIGLLTLGSTASIVGGTGTIAISNVGTITGAGFGLTLGGAQGGTLTSILGTGAGTLTKEGAGSWTLSGASTYNGSTSITAGTIKLGATGTTSASGPLGTNAGGTTVADGATLDVNAMDFATTEALTINGIGVSGVGALYTSSGAGPVFRGAITLGSAALIGSNTTAISNFFELRGGINNGGFNLTLGGAKSTSVTTVKITGVGGLIKEGAGTARLSIASDYTGTTTVTTGRLENGAANVFPNTNLILNGGIYATGVVGTATGYAETFDQLSLTASSTIDFAGATNTNQDINFSASDALSWTGTLTITDWTGSNGGSGTNGQIFVGSNTSGLITQLLQVAFTSYSRGKLLSTGELVPLELIWYSSNNTATNANLLINWFSVNNGTGSNPTSWEGDFYVQSGHTMYLTADWGSGATGVRLLISALNGTATCSGKIDLNGFKLKSDIGKLTVFSSNTFTNTSGTAGTIEEDIVLNGASTIVNAGNVTVSGGITGAFALTASGIGHTTISGVIATGVGSIVKAGTGTLTLSGNNTFSGGVSYTTNSTGNGKINIGSVNALGTGTFNISANTFDNSSGADLTITNPLTFSCSSTIATFTGTNNLTQSTGAIALTTGTAYIDVVANSLSLNGVISGTSIGIYKKGVGTMILSGNNTYTGTTTVFAGTLKLGANGTSPNGPLGTIGAATTVSSGAVLDLNGYTLATAEALTLNGTGLTSSPAGALTNTGGNASYSGAITLGASGATITSTTSGTLTCSGAVGGNTYALKLDGAVNSLGTMSGVIGTTSGTVTKNGAGTWTLSGANTFTGQTTVAAGTLKLGANGSGINGPLGTVTGNTSVTAGAVLDLNGFTLVTAEPLTLNGAGLTALAAGALTNTGGNASFSGPITLGSSGATITATTSGTLTCSGNLTGTGYALTLDGAASSSGTMSSYIGTSTAGTVTKNGAGTWTFGNAATNYTGATLISAGTLKLSNAAALGTSSATTVSSGAVLDLNGITLSSARPLTLNGTGLTASPAGALTNTGANASFSGAITLGSASTITATSSGTLTCSGTVATGAFSLILDGAGGTGTMSGVLSTPNSLTKNGAGTWVLSGINTYTGITTVSTGTLKLSGSGSIANTSSIVVASAATFDVSATTSATTLGSATIFSIPSIGAIATSTLNSASSKALTLGSTGGITFSDYGGANGSSPSNAPLTVTGVSGSIALANAPVTVTTSTALAAGTYVLIANNGATGVTGTPGTLTMNGADLNSGATYSLAVTSAQLVLTITRPTITLASNIVAAANNCASSTKVPIQSFILTPSSGNGNLTNVGFTTTGGTFIQTDISNYKLWYGTSNDLSAVVSPLATLTPTGGNGTSEIFTAFTSPTLTSGTPYYFWITMDVETSPTNNATLTVSAITTSNLTSTSSKAGGPTSAGGAQTLNATSVGGSISGGTSVCTGTNSTALTISGNTGSVTKWQYATASDFSTGLTDVANTTLSLTATDLSVTRYYRAVVTNGACVSANSTAATISVDVASAGGSISGGASVCTGTNSTALTLNGNTGSVTKWQYATASDFSTGLTDVANTTTSLTATDLSTTRYYRAVVANGACSAANSSSDLVTVIAQPTISTHPSDATITEGGTYSPSIVATGGVSLTYQWRYATSSGGVYSNVVDNTPTNATYTSATTNNMSLTGNVTAGTYYYKCYVSSTGSGCNAVLSNVSILTINSGATTFYSNKSQPNTHVTNLNNWNSQADGNGVAPQSFTTAGQSFVIQNGHHYKVSSEWTGSSTSKIYVNTGAIFDVFDNLTTWEGIYTSGNGVIAKGTVQIPIILQSATTLNSDYVEGLTITGNINNAGYALTIDGTNPTSITTSVISGSGALNKNGSGKLTITDANTFTGATNINAGVVNIQNATALGTTAGSVTVASGAALELQGGITVGAKALTLNNDGISSAGALRNISGANTWGGAITLSTNAARINSDTGTLTLSGAITNGAVNLTIGGAGTVTANGIIGSGAGNLTKDGSGTLALGATNTYSGTTTLTAGTLTLGAVQTALSNDIVMSGGTFNAAGIAITTSGNWINNGAVFTHGNNTVCLTGAGKTIGGTSSTTFNNLALNGGSTYSLGIAQIVSDTLSFNGGSKLTLSTYDLSIGTGGITGYDASNFVVTNSTGKLIQQSIGVGASIEKQTFPIGISSTSYTPCMVANTGATDNFSARVAENVLTNGATGSSKTTKCVDRSWFVDESTASGSNVTLTLQWNASQELAPFDRSAVMVGHYTGGVWDLVSATTSGSNPGPFSVSRDSITSFSPFDIESPNALPIELLYFTAKQSGTKVKLDWATATEQNNDYFVVERSQDGTNFAEVFRKKGAGNSVNTLYYNGFDNDPLEGISYYRLKQVDYDAKFKYSDIQSVNFKFNTAEVGIKIYPNPAIDNKFTVDYTIEKADQVEVYFYNSIGQITHQEAWSTNKGINTKEFYFPEISEGMYILELKASDGTSVKQHVKM